MNRFQFKHEHILRERQNSSFSIKRFFAIMLFSGVMVANISGCDSNGTSLAGDNSVNTTDTDGISNNGDDQTTRPVNDNGQSNEPLDTDPENNGDQGLIPDNRPEDNIDSSPTSPLQNPASDPDNYSDEFDTDTLANWQLRHEAEGTAAQYTLLDIATTTPGYLTIVPTKTPGWFQAADAPLIFKNIRGDFSLETSVLTTSFRNPALAPGSNFNSAGLMARNPTGNTGPENHIMVNVGRQDSRIFASLGSEVKNTINSSSTLELLAGSTNGRLTLCRVGNEFLAYRFLDNESSWTPLASYTRTDLPDTLQVGLVVNGFSGPDLSATFDYVRLRIPSDTSDCITPRR